MKDVFLKSCRYAGGVLAACLMATAAWAQTPSITSSSATDEVVSPPSQGVQNTGTDIVRCAWRDYGLNEQGNPVSGTLTFPPAGLSNDPADSRYFGQAPYSHVYGPHQSSGGTYDFEGFCWDGSNPGFSWRLREHWSVLSIQHNNTVKIDIGRTFNPAVILGAHIVNADIAVAHQELPAPHVLDAQQNQTLLFDARGMGDFFLVATYEYGGGIYLRADLIRNPVSFGTTTGNAETEYQEITVIPDVKLGDGTNPNVNTSIGSEFAVTFEGVNSGSGNNEGKIYGIIGKLYTSPLFTVTPGNSTTGFPFRRPSIESYDVAQLFISGYPNAFRVETGTSDPASEPDVALTDWYNLQFPTSSASRAFFTYRTFNSNTNTSRIGVTSATVTATPSFEVDEMPCSACSVYPLHWPRIAAGFKLVATNPQNYIVVFQEDRPAAPGCEAEPGRSIIRTIVHNYAGGVVINGFGPPRNHINQCLTDIGDGFSSKPAITVASFRPAAPSEGLIVWQYDKNSNSQINSSSLSGSDIICHNFSQQTGVPPASGTTVPFTNPGSHLRVNNGPGAAGNQIAPSIASRVTNRVVTAWFDSYAGNVIMAHDEGNGTNGTLFRPSAPSDPASPAEPVEAQSDAASLGAVRVVPNPTGQSGSLDISLRKGERIATIELTDMNSGRVVSIVKASSLPAELLQGTTLHLPLQKLGAANLAAGYYVVKVTTNRTVHTTRLSYESPEQKN